MLNFASLHILHVAKMSVDVLAQLELTLEINK